MLDWQVGENDWDDLTPVTTGSPPSRHPRLPHLKRWLALGFFVILITGAGAFAFLQYRAGVGLRQIRTDLQSTLDLEAWAMHSGDVSLQRSLEDPNTPENYRSRLERTLSLDLSRDQQQNRPETATQITNLDIRDDLAMVDVVSSNAPGLPWASVRETRFYHLVNGKWLRTAPQEKFWGVERKFPTDKVDFVYRALDEDAVAEVMNRLTPYLIQLETDFGVQFPNGDTKLVVEVLPVTGSTPQGGVQQTAGFSQGAGLPQDGEFSQRGAAPQGGVFLPAGAVGYRLIGNHLIVSSPRLARIPGDISLGSQLLYNLAQPLASYLLSQRPGMRQTSFQWRNVMSGLVAWEAEALTYTNANLNTQGLGLLKESLANGDSISLREIAMQGSVDRSRRPLLQAGSQELIDYIVKKHGRGLLVPILNELPQSENLPQLVAKVLGVNLEKFEQDWMDYMRTKYAIKLIPNGDRPARTSMSRPIAPFEDQIPNLPTDGGRRGQAGFTPNLP